MVDRANFQPSVMAIRRANMGDMGPLRQEQAAAAQQAQPQQQIGLAQRGRPMQAARGQLRPNQFAGRVEPTLNNLSQQFQRQPMFGLGNMGRSMQDEARSRGADFYQQYLANPSMNQSAQQSVSDLGPEQQQEYLQNMASNLASFSSGRPPAFAVPQQQQQPQPATLRQQQVTPSRGVDLASNSQQRQAAQAGRSIASRSQRADPFANVAQFGQRQGRGGRQPVFSREDATNRQNQFQVQQRNVDRNARSFQRKPMFASRRKLT